ncbi:MAG: PIN domain-containing protein [Synechococcales cyanobacterium K44_A2020_017]|nr:PIN domain-containing protein [Synechococcales cyanobacterium K32_A2020_035]MBF2093396.1 PIN domain-containing protein [Synechococcales cyanobacterium K44_A2020_017]
MERMISIADTGFIVALVDRQDSYYQDVKAIYLQQKEIIVPQSVLAEVAYLLGRAAGISSVVQFLRSLKTSRFELTALKEEDIAGIGDILEEYQDSRIDFVDASVMAIAERLNLTIVLTLDRRDFSLYRPQHCPAFTLLP